MATVKVEFTQDTEEYRLVIDGDEEQEFVDLGEPFQAEVSGKTYLTTQVDPETECPVFLITGKVEEVTGVIFEDVIVDEDTADGEVEVEQEG